MLNLLNKKKSGLEGKIVREYDKMRYLKDKRHICHAPFNNMYFNIRGEAAPCWLTLTEADKFPEKSLRDIWFGEKFQQIRKHVEKTDLSYKCNTCKQNLERGNYVSVLSKLYDLPYQLQKYPSQMEFELSNICNLECVMCKGELSSTIRKNREQLPAIQTPYDDAFVDQLEEFIPHLKEAKFLGGEPFLIETYFEIWERMIAINPDIKIHITTNGSVWNNRVQRILDKLNCQITLSLDSVVKETYESIRIRANFDKVMENFHHFLDYSKERKVWYGMSVNPMQQNWWEMPGYVEFCNEHNVPVWFNTIVYPHKNALWTLPPDELGKVYGELSATGMPSQKNANESTFNNNSTNYRNLLEGQIKSWWKEAQQREQEKADIPKNELQAKATEYFNRNLLDYFFNDHYLTEGYKRSRIKSLKEKLVAIEGHLNGEKEKLYSYLYLKPISIVVKELAGKSALDLAENWKEELE